MLYALLYPFHESFHLFNVLRYVSVRSLFAALTSFALCLLLGGPVIGWLTRLKVGQQVREDGPQTHLKKSGTPTMGGLLILTVLIFSTLLWVRPENPYVWICLAATVWFGLIGMVDDYSKLKAKKSQGLTSRAKLLLQTLGATAIMAAYFHTSPGAGLPSSFLALPFLKSAIQLPALLYFPFGMLVIVGASNAVNLTDGLDGLAAGSSALVALAFAGAAYLVSNIKMAEYLFIPYLSGVSEVVVFCAAVFGACLGFLWFNAYPAQVFMGDTGSLALGGLFGTVAVLTKQEILLLVVGGIFVIETLSVMIQVTSFKLRGKRVFKMAPIHHHFELHGVEEPKVIVRFWIVAIILLMLSLATFKIR